MSRTVPDAHPELLHYTSVAGLFGILESQSLRATHSAFQNDSTEISLFFKWRLAKLLESGIRAELAADPELQVLPEFAKTPHEADEAVTRYATEMADAIRRTSSRLHQPYLTCFSAPANKRVESDGLLSQWRGYGKDGGYALVFDAKRLEEHLVIEGASFWYEHAHWGNVHYHQDDSDLVNAEPEILKAEDALREVIRRYIRNPVATELESTFEPVAILSCLYKHWGFHEEREVRIVAILPGEELVQEGRRVGEARPVRQPKTFVRNGTPVPYLDLFSQESKGAPIHLPILRVIIGPHPQSELRHQAVKLFLRTKGIDAEVLISQIPYVGT